MKKLMYAAVLGMAIGFTSCSEEEIIEFGCNTAIETLRVPVETAFNAYDADPTQLTCEAVKTAVETYRNSQCGDDFFDDRLIGFPLDCANIGGGV